METCGAFFCVDQAGGALVRAFEKKWDEDAGKNVMQREVRRDSGTISAAPLTGFHIGDNIRGMHGNHMSGHGSTS